MIVPSFFIAALTHFVTASDSGFRLIPRGSYRLPLQFTLSESGRIIDGFSELSLDDMYLTVTPRLEHDPQSDTTYIEASSLLVPGHRIIFGASQRYHDESSAILNPPFTNFDVNSILISPASAFEDIFVVQPPNPSDYAYQGQVYYARMIREMYRVGWRVPTAVRFSSVSGDTPLHTTDGSFMACSLSTSEIDHIKLPQSLMEEFMLRLSPLRIILNPETLSITLPGLDRAQVEALPSFNVSIQADDGTEAQIGTLDPFDYVVATEEVPNTYRVSFAPSFTIPKTIIKDLVIHIDYEHQRVGFGDPLVEL